MDIRAELKSKIPDLGDGEWALLEDDGHVAEVESDAAGVEHLVERVERVRRVGAPRRHAGDKVGATADPAELARRASSRADAISALLAADACRREEVVAFRREVLRGNLLKPEQVAEWVERRSREGEQVRRKTLGEPWEVDPAAEGREWIDGRPVVRYETPSVEYAAPEGGWVQAAASSSELERLRKVGEGLASSYGWEQAQATIFLLTGAVPILPAIRARTVSKLPVVAATRIVLEVDPTVTPREVAERYAEVRTRVTGGQRSRRMSEKHLRLAIFAESHEQGTWADRMARWNSDFRDWRYTEPTNFQRDATGAIRRLLRPPFNP